MEPECQGDQGEESPAVSDRDPGEPSWKGGQSCEWWCLTPSTG